MPWLDWAGRHQLSGPAVVIRLSSSSGLSAPRTRASISFHRPGRRVERSAHGHLDLHVEPALIALGHQLETDDGHQGEGSEQEHDGCGHHHSRFAERPLDHPAVGHVDRTERGDTLVRHLAALRTSRSQRAAAAGISVRATNSAQSRAKLTVIANWLKKMPAKPEMKTTAGRRPPCQCAGGDRHRYLVAAGDRSGGGAFSLVQPAVDALEHHDRAVDQHADSERDAGQRDHVQGESVEVHQGDRGEDRDRDRGADDQGRPQVAEEEHQHEHRQRGAEQGSQLDVVHRLPDELGAVHQDRDLGAARRSRG